MASRLTLPLLGAVAVAAVVAVVVDRRTPSTSEQQRDRRRLVPGFSADAVSRIDLVRPEQTVTLTRAGARWQLGGLEVDLAAVDGLLGSLQFATVQRRVPRASEMGLDRPRVELVVTSATGVHRVRIGGDDVSGQLVYVAVDDGPDAALVERRLQSLADVPPTVWISRALTIVDAAAATKLEVGGVVLDRDRLLRPDAAGGDAWADPEQARAVWHAVETARAIEVLPIVPDAAGATERTRLLLDGRLQATVHGGCGPGRTEVVRVDDARLCFENAALAPLLQSAAALVDARPLPVALDEIRRVTIRAANGKTELELVRANGRWRMGALDAEDAAVRAWLSSLLALPKALPKAASAPPAPLVVELEAAARTVSAPLAVAPDPLSLRSLRVFTVNPDHVKRLTVDGVDRTAAATAVAELHALGYQHQPLVGRPRTVDLTLTDGTSHRLRILDCVLTADDGPPAHLDAASCAKLGALR